SRTPTGPVTAYKDSPTPTNASGMPSEPPDADPHVRWCGGRRGEPGAYPIECAQHDQQLGGASPLWRLMAPTTSQWQLLLREEGGKEAGDEVATLGTHGAPSMVAAGCAYEAWRSG